MLPGEGRGPAAPRAGLGPGLRRETTRSASDPVRMGGGEGVEAGRLGVGPHQGRVIVQRHLEAAGVEQLRHKAHVPNVDDCASIGQER